jgi:hypothetical protein
VDPLSLKPWTMTDPKSTRPSRARRRRLLVTSGLAFLVNAYDSRAEVAKPLTFRAGVVDLKDASAPSRVYPWAANGSVPTPLTEWACKMGAVGTRSDSNGVRQVGSLECACPSGSVSVTVICDLSSDLVVHGSDMTIRDTSGHAALLTAACSNAR